MWLDSRCRLQIQFSTKGAVGMPIYACRREGLQIRQLDETCMTYHRPIKPRKRAVEPGQQYPVQARTEWSRRGPEQPLARWPSQGRCHSTSHRPCESGRIIGPCLSTQVCCLDPI